MFLLSRPVCVYVFVCTYAHMFARMHTLSHSPAFCSTMDYSSPGSSVHGIFQARLLEWVTISSFRGSSWPTDHTHPLASPALAGEFFTTSANLEALNSIEKASLFFLCTESD